MNKTACDRCGQCCLGGGPALHGRDRKAIEDGFISRGQMVAYLAGELLRDPATGGVLPLVEEVIKLRTAPGTTTCIFYAPEGGSCAIYDRRPAECHAQKCWDPDKLLAMYEQDRLSRSDLVQADSALGELMAEHESRCGRKRMQQLAQRVESDQEALGELLAMLRFDEAIRDLVAEKAGVSREHMEFYFGRPVALVLKTFGLKLKRVGGNYTIIRDDTGTKEPS